MIYTRPHSHRIRGYLCLFPIICMNPIISQERDIPPFSDIGYHCQLKKPFPGFLGKSSRDYVHKIPKKMGTRTRPLMHSNGGSMDSENV